MALTYSQRRSMFKRSERLAAKWNAEAVRAERERRSVDAARIEAALQAERERDAAAPRDVDSLKPGDLVRTSTGWHVVARVNAKSVSVETPWSWTDRVPHDRIIETRKAEG